MMVQGHARLAEKEVEGRARQVMEEIKKLGMDFGK